MDKYISVYDFNKALNICEKLINELPTDAILYSIKSNILVKTNKIDEAIYFLKDVKRSPYYRDYSKYSPNSWFMDVINTSLENCIDEKKNNYVYKPRNLKNGNNKRNIILVDADTGEVIEK